MACFAGCSKKKTLQDVTGTEMRSAYQETEDARPKVVRMDTTMSRGSVKLQGVNYEYSIKRLPDDHLPTAPGDDGNTYVDNRIQLDIKANGRPFFSRTFVKSNFEALIDSSFVKKGILEGLVFDKVKDDKLNFSLSISYPQTDMYESMMIEVTPTGGMSIRKDESMDGSDVE